MHLATVHGQLSAPKQRLDLDQPAGNWPNHWGGAVHEQDGGPDRRELLRNFLSGTTKTGSGTVAWDDMSDVALDGDLMVDARKPEMR